MSHERQRPSAPDAPVFDRARVADIDAALAAAPGVEVPPVDVDIDARDIDAPVVDAPRAIAAFESRRSRRVRERRSTRVRAFVAAGGAVAAAAIIIPVAMFGAGAFASPDGSAVPVESGVTTAQRFTAVDGTGPSIGTDAGSYGVAVGAGTGTSGSGAGGAAETGGDGTLQALVQWPLATRDQHITSNFGPRMSPCSGCSSNHRGIDFGVPQGTPVGAIAAGTVISASYSDGGGLGVHVVVEHTIDGQTVQSVYGHLVTGSITVRVGDAVGAGTRIGSVGNTGASTGPHLHLETILGGIHVDPLSFLYRYADGREVEITDRPEIPWGAPEPGGEGEGWTPDQTVTAPPAPGDLAQPDPVPVATDPASTEGTDGATTPTPDATGEPSTSPDPSPSSEPTPDATTPAGTDAPVDSGTPADEGGASPAATP